MRLSGHTTTQYDAFGKHRHIHKTDIPKSVQVFDLETDLAPSERWVIADILKKRAMAILIDDETEEKRAAKIESEADRYCKCGHEAIRLNCPECDTGYFIRMSCRSRICERCGRIYKKKINEQIKPLIRGVQSKRRKGFVVSLLTLTVTSARYGDGLPDRDQIKRLYKETGQFLKMHYGTYAARESKTGKIYENRKKYIGAGWIATLEIGNDNNNIHCHAITYGPIRQWYKLRDSWRKITGDSHGVDIRAVHSIEQVTNYVLKYITKPPQTDSYEKIADYVLMIKGSRRLRTGGIFYNRIKNIKHENKQNCTCTECNIRLIMTGIVNLDDDLPLADLYATKRLFAKQRQAEQAEKMANRENIPESVCQTDCQYGIESLPKWLN